MKKTKRPKQLKIGVFSYIVEWSKVLREVPAAGMTSSSTTTIYISPLQSPEQLKDTLVHEALHAMWKQTSLLVRHPDEDPDSEGERIIQDLAPLIYAFVRDNPEVVAWLLED